MKKSSIPIRESKIRRSDILANSSDFGTNNLMKLNRGVGAGNERNSSILSLNPNKLISRPINSDGDFKPKSNIGAYNSNLRNMRDLAENSGKSIFG